MSVNTADVFASFKLQTSKRALSVAPALVSGLLIGAAVANGSSSPVFKSARLSDQATSRVGSKLLQPIPKLGSRPGAPVLKFPKLRLPTDGTDGTDGESGSDSEYGRPSDESSVNSRASSGILSNSDDEDDGEVDHGGLLFCSPNAAKAAISSQKRVSSFCADLNCKISHSKEVTSRSQKDFAMDMTLADIASVGQCSIECENGRDCLYKVRMGDVNKLREYFWKTRTQAAPMPKEKKKKIANLFDICNAAKTQAGTLPDGNTRYRLSFDVGDQTVCEAAFLILLGFQLSKSASDAPSQWRSAKKHFCYPSQKLDEAKKAFEIKFLKSGEYTCTTKGGLAKAWIEDKAKEYGSDAFASAEGATDDGDLKDIVILPYMKPSLMYKDFIVEMEIFKVPIGIVPSYDVFKRKFSTMKKKYRLMRCKGSFPTCEICNNCDAFLQNRSKTLDDDQRLVVLSFKRLHLRQQAIERQQMERAKLESLKYRTVDGYRQPVQAFIYSDAMTESMGSTPRIGRDRHSKPGKQIKNRLFTVQVICGADCQFYMNISVDQMISGGANLSIEIQRVALEELSERLAALGQSLPKRVQFQFDNCGENKNKEMFAYFAALLEEHIFEEIRVNFLIVGHTHSNLDQSFSVYSKKIRACEFIGSVPALDELYHVAHKREYLQPIFHKREHIHCVHDWVAYFAPIVNKKLKWYKIPHCFLMTLHSASGRAICQYQVFSPEDDKDAQWLPPQPLEFQANVTDRRSASLVSLDVQLRPFIAVDSDERLLGELGVTEDRRNDRSRDESVAKRYAFQNMRHELLALELNALAASMETMEYQRDPEDPQFEAVEDSSSVNRRQMLTKELHRRMVAYNSSEAGYILWLDPTRLPNGVATITQYLSKRPPLLPSIPLKYRAAHSSTTEDETEITGMGKKRAKEAATEQAASDIATVAKSMLEWGKKSSNHAVESDQRSIYAITQGFQKRILAPQEMAFYRALDSRNKVWARAQAAHEVLRRQPWALITRAGVDSGALIEDRVAHFEAALNFSYEHQGEIQKNRYNRAPTVEAIGREGRVAPTAQGKRCFVPGCQYLADGQCQDQSCGLWVCEAHGLRHPDHEKFATLEATTAYRRHLVTSGIQQQQPAQQPPSQQQQGGSGARSKEGCKAILRERGLTEAQINSYNDNLKSLQMAVKEVRAPTGARPPPAIRAPAIHVAAVPNLADASAPATATNEVALLAFIRSLNPSQRQALLGAVTEPMSPKDSGSESDDSD